MILQPHIDGAWPAAGIDKETGEYLHEWVCCSSRRLLIEANALHPAHRQQTTRFGRVLRSLSTSTRTSTTLPPHHQFQAQLRFSSHRPTRSARFSRSASRPYKAPSWSSRTEMRVDPFSMKGRRSAMVAGKLSSERISCMRPKDLGNSLRAKTRSASWWAEQGRATVSTR